MSVAVFLPNQNTSVEAPAHKANLSLAQKLITAKYAVWIDAKRSVRMSVDLSWAAIKVIFRTPEPSSKSAPIPVLLPPLAYYSFNTNYPPSGQETDARARQQRLWSGQAHVPYRERTVTA